MPASQARPNGGEMANEYLLASGNTYQETKYYRNASSDARRLINRYKSECDVSDEHMFLILLGKDLDAVPKDKRDNADIAGKGMLVIGVLLLWSSLQSAMNAKPGETNVPLIFLSLGSFLLVCIVYYFGLLNPYKRATHQLAKRMKDMPEVPDFDEWCMQHPIHNSSKSAGRTNSANSGKKKSKKRKGKR